MGLGSKQVTQSSEIEVKIFIKYEKTKPKSSWAKPIANTCLLQSMSLSPIKLTVQREVKFIESFTPSPPIATAYRYMYLYIKLIFRDIWSKNNPATCLTNSIVLWPEWNDVPGHVERDWREPIYNRSYTILLPIVQRSAKFTEIELLILIANKDFTHKIVLTCNIVVMNLLVTQEIKFTKSQPSW